MVPKISVIIPAYNAECFIKKTLDSVLNQTLQPYEIIVVDDGSTDKTSSIVSSMAVKYVLQQNLGTAEALNHGVRRATGDILAFLDHDDIWLPNKLELQTKVLQSDPKIDMVFTLMENVIINETLHEKVDVDFGPMNGVHKSAFLVKTSSFHKVGYFSNRSGTQEFLNWFADAMDLGLKAHTIQKVLVQRIIHGSNQTILNKEMKNDFPRVLKAIMDRRRSQ